MTLLTSTQKKHLATIKWLLSKEHKYLRTGRTTLLAYGYIEVALKDRGNFYIPRDHFPQYYSDDCLMKYIIEIWETDYKFKKKYEGIKIEVKISQRSFRLV